MHHTAKGALVHNDNKTTKSHFCGRHHYPLKDFGWQTSPGQMTWLCDLKHRSVALSDACPMIKASLKIMIEFHLPCHFDNACELKVQSSHLSSS